MKHLKNLGKALNKTEQKTILGGGINRLKKKTDCDVNPCCTSDYQCIQYNNSPEGPAHFYGTCEADGYCYY